MELNNLVTSYPLSPLQQGMLFHTLYAPHSGVDIEQLIIDLPEALNVSAFREAWQRLVERHPVLRTSFHWEGLKEPLQAVHRQAEASFSYHDLRDLSVQEQQDRLEDYLQADRQEGFQLAEAPLMRVALFQTGQANYHCVWTFHHILLDGRSFPILLKELFEFYGAFCQGCEVSLPSPRLYQDHIDWLYRQDLGPAETFWRQALQGFTAPTPLVVDRARAVTSAGQEVGYGEQEIQLSEQATTVLQTLAQHHQFTMNTLVQGAWALLLSRYSGEEEVLFGATRACRRSGVADGESIVGLLINTLPVRVQVSPDMMLLPWLKMLRAQHLAVRAYEHTPLSKIQEWSEIRGGIPLFESILVFENYLLNSVLRRQDQAWERRSVRLLEQTNYPLTVTGYLEAELLLKISYDKSYFDEATIGRMLGHLQTLLEGMAANPERRLADLPLLSQAERQRLLERQTEISLETRPDRCLHQLFEAQVERTPEAIAVTFEAHSLTYRELNDRANRLAYCLQQKGVGPEVLVSLCLERSLEIVVAILGVLKAGGAYVPLDPAYPPERLAFMLEDTQSPVLLTQSDLLAHLPKHQAETICLDTAWEAIIAATPEQLENPQSGATPDNLAYVIYTSGSTGQPKGVLITQANVVRLFTATQPWFHFDERDVWTLFHSYAFDFSVWEFWGALLYGGRLVVVPYWVSRSPEAFYHLLSQERVTVLNQTPSAFRQLIWAEQQLASAPELPLRLVVFGGEALELHSLKPWMARHGDQMPQLVNMYGITETTVHVTYRPLTEADLHQAWESVIGCPIPDLQLYLLDQSLQPVPVGVPGELVVGGAGLARGYLHRPELTQERFITNPFSQDPNARLYRSGDLARYLPDGDIEYLGRIDHQVKIRGFRIELGEIEAALAQHPAVREAIVITREDTPGEKRLVAYLTLNQEDRLISQQLRQFLKDKLPDYMIPSAWAVLETFPLTPNGKIDRRALPPPDQLPAAWEGAFMAPRNTVETELAAIWAEVLRLERLSVYDNFFQLGGHSLLATQVMSRVREAFQLDLPLRVLFEAPTVAELALIIMQKEMEQFDNETLAQMLSELDQLTTFPETSD